MTNRMVLLVAVEVAVRAVVLVTAITSSADATALFLLSRAN